MNSSTWDETSSFPLRPLLVNRVLTRNPQDSEMEKPGFHEKTIRRLCNHYVKWCMYYVLCNYMDYIKSNKTTAWLVFFNRRWLFLVVGDWTPYRLKISLNSQIYIYIYYSTSPLSKLQISNLVEASERQLQGAIALGHSMSVHVSPIRFPRCLQPTS